MNTHRAYDGGMEPIGPERHGADEAIEDAEEYTRESLYPSFVVDVTEDRIHGRGPTPYLRVETTGRLSAAGTELVRRVPIERGED